MNGQQLLTAIGDKRIDEALARVESLLITSQPDMFKPLLQDGRRIRPAILLLIAGTDNPETQTMAAAVELIHQASKLHDAISDENLNQNKVNLNLLAGDAMLATGLRLAGSRSADLAAVVTDMAAGQAAQLTGKTQPLSKDYMRIITKKTALLFEATCAIGAELAGMDEGEIASLRRFGLDFGKAFQLADDIVDGDVPSDRLPAALKLVEEFIDSAESSLPADKRFTKLSALARAYARQTVGKAP